jgi:hypothetical protein
MIMDFPRFFRFAFGRMLRPGAALSNPRYSLPTPPPGLTRQSFVFQKGAGCAAKVLRIRAEQEAAIVPPGGTKWPICRV